MAEQAIVWSNFFRIFTPCLFAGKLKNVEGWRQSKCAGLVLLGSVSCEACRVNPVAPQGMTKNRSLGLWNVDSYSSCPLGVADIYASLFDKAAAALIRSEFRVRAIDRKSVLYCKKAAAG